MIRSYRRAADVEDLEAMTQGKGSPVEPEGGRRRSGVWAKSLGVHDCIERLDKG